MRQRVRAFGLVGGSYRQDALIKSQQLRDAEGRRKMARTHEWKNVHDPMGDRDELYDLVRDPWELVNVVDDLEHAGVVAEMRLRLLDWSVQTEDSPPVPLPAFS
jgi:arylsulfatase A-like enzyme